jgi:hypothetical protein
VKTEHRPGTIKHERRYVTNGRTFILRTLHGKSHRGWWYLYERRGQRVVFIDAEDSLARIKRNADREANTDPRGEIR